MNKLFTLDNSEYKTIDVVPTKETVDYYAIYRYYNSVPVFNRFEEQRDMNSKHINELKDEMLSGNWNGRVGIKVDINTMKIVKGNHTYDGYVLAREQGFNEPLTVEYIDVDEDVIAALTADEKVRKWRLIDYVKANMFKDGKKNSYNYLYDTCMGHSYLSENKEPKFSYALACTLGKSKPFTKAIKKGTFKVHDNKCWEKTYENLNEALMLRKAIGLDGYDNCWMECFLAEYYYVKKNNISYFKTGGFKTVLNVAKDYAREMGGLMPLQKYDYWQKNLNAIVARAIDWEVKKIA